jgi:hypothetical protein
MDDDLEQFAALIADLQAQIDKAKRPRETAVVTAIVANTVTLRIGGAVGAPIAGFHHLSTYIPTVGDVVWVDFQQTDALVLGKEA